MLIGDLYLNPLLIFLTPWARGVGFNGFYSQKLFGLASFVVSVSILGSLVVEITEV